jgi:esterase FrsA
MWADAPGGWPYEWSAFARKYLEAGDTLLASFSVSTPVHLFSVTGKYAAAPVLFYSGGVDTYKMDLHPVCLTLAQRLGITVLSYDIPGTGESPVPLSVKGDEIVLGIVNELPAQIGSTGDLSLPEHA